jgi:hypothetical protein
MDAFVFGYGSLVNRSTHDYARAHPARISGWRRAWRHVVDRDVAFLTAIPDPDTEIDGLAAFVPAHDWPALDAREFSYDRAAATNVMCRDADGHTVHIYHAPPERQAQASTLRPVLLSYLDVVVQGFQAEFGPEGVARFFDTTDGWDAPILNDRATPHYSRHRALKPEETALVDTHLKRLGVSLFEGPFR